MTTAFWLATGQTVTFLAAVAWAWWATGRIAVTDDTAQDTNEAAVELLGRVDAWFDRAERSLARLERPEPATQPYPVVGPDTMPETEAVRLIDDVELAWEVARLEQIMRGDKPSPRPRKAKA